MEDNKENIKKVSGMVDNEKNNVQDKQTENEQIKNSLKGVNNVFYKFNSCFWPIAGVLTFIHMKMGDGELYFSYQLALFAVFLVTY